MKLKIAKEEDFQLAASKTRTSSVFTCTHSSCGVDCTDFKHSEDGDYIEVSGGSYNSGDRTISQTMYCGNEGLGNRKVDMIHDPADLIYSQSPGIVSVL